MVKICENGFVGSKKPAEPFPQTTGKESVMKEYL